MKQCPKCNASVSDTAKFCIKCGFNIKKHEEEQTKCFCPECGTEFSGGKFCPECGYDVSKELEPKPTKKEDIDLDDFGLDDVKPSPSPKKKTKGKKKIDLDDFGLDLDDAGSLLDNQIKQNKLSEQLIMFDYENHKTGGYVIKKFTDTIETNVVLPEGVVAISDGAFENSLVISVKLPDGVKLIGKRAFANCKYLNSINIPSSVNRIDNEAFLNCVALNINIPKHVSIKGTDILKNTLTEAIALQEAENARLAKLKAAEEKRLKELATAKDNLINKLKLEAEKRRITIKLPLEKVEAVTDIKDLTKAAEYVMEVIQAEVLKQQTAMELADAKRNAKSTCESYALKNGVSYEKKYQTLIDSAKTVEEVRKVISEINKTIDDICKKEVEKRAKEELTQAKNEALVEVKKYAEKQGQYFWSKYEKTIKDVKKIADISKAITKVKNEIDKEKEEKRLAKIAADKRAAEQKVIDARVADIKKSYSDAKSKVMIEKNYIYFGLWPQAIKDSKVKIIKTDEDGAYGDDDHMYRVRYFYNDKTKQKDIVKYHQFQYIRWIVLKETRDNYLLVSDLILSGVTFNDTLADKNGLPANNYKQSNVRDFLSWFVDEAFGPEGKKKIEDTVVDNSKKTTGLVNGYFSENTVDKAFLLSYQEVEKYFKKISIKRRTTDYAKAYLGNYDYYDWWLRSPGLYNGGYNGKTGADYVSCSRLLIDATAVNRVCGLVPAIVLKKK